MQLSQFIHQKSFEKIVLNVRRHPITFVPTALFFLIMAVLPLVMRSIIVNSSGFEESPFGTGGLLVIITLAVSIYYLCLVIFFYSSFTSFYLDLLIITNDRLLDVDQHGLFARTVSEMNLAQVQDITTEVKGFFPTFFNYGHLIIQNAGAITKFHLQNVRSPNRLRELILQLVEADRKREAQEYGAAAGAPSPAQPTYSPHS